MSVTVRPAAERGTTRTGWLDSRHSFSFGEYHDPRHMGFRTLRVINEDVVEPSRGFGPHPHRDMEIVTYVLSGTLAHRDSLGSGSLIRPNEVQIMSAGTGITHSEVNPSPSEAVHLLQIWLLPARAGLEPRYEQRRFDPRELRGRLRTVVAPDGHDGALVIHQDATLAVARLADGEEVEHALARGRHAWLQVAHGDVTVNGTALREGDGAAVSDEPRVTVRAPHGAELLLFDLA